MIMKGKSILFLIILNRNGTNFVGRSINDNVVTNGVGVLKGATFAPLNLPSRPITQ